MRRTVAVLAVVGGIAAVSLGFVAGRVTSADERPERSTESSQRPTAEGTRARRSPTEVDQLSVAQVDESRTFFAGDAPANSDAYEPDPDYPYEVTVTQLVDLQEVYLGRRYMGVAIRFTNLSAKALATGSDGVALLGTDGHQYDWDQYGGWMCDNADLERPITLLPGASYVQCAGIEVPTIVKVERVVVVGPSGTFTGRFPDSGMWEGE